MPTKTNVEVVEGRGAGEASMTSGFADISDGVIASLQTGSGDSSTATIFVETKGATKITVEFSPDGDNWFEPRSESPVDFSSADTDLLHIDYDAEAVRLTASDTTNVKARIRVVA